jgi:anti-sigma-K factor RskA
MSDQELSSIELLAGEYVLGSLSGADLERFKQLMDENPQVQRLVVEWQELLVPLSEQTREVEPPPRVLDRLMQKISAPAPRAKTSWWKNLNIWRPLAFGNGLLSLCLAAFIAFQVMQPVVETNVTDEAPVTTGDLIYVGVLEDAEQKPKVAVLAYNKPFRLEIKSKNKLLAAQGKELRLWMVDRDTEQTVFLTSVPAGQARINVSDALWKKLKTAKQLVISADPVESAKSQPSEQILFKGVCVNLKNWSAGS